MKTLLKNAKVVNVFTDRLEEKNVLICDGKIIRVGDVADSAADEVVDLGGKVICPGFIDGHIHIESTMLTPERFAEVSLPHGTTAVMADPHEIANVAGTAGIAYMLQASESLPLDVYVMLPSCVPATPFDEAGAVLEAEDIAPFYDHPRVLGLGEMMNYPGVLANDPKIMRKIEDARARGRIINGHAPLLSGEALDLYISAGIRDDHECSSAEEAIEHIEKGQWVMVRQGTVCRNLEALLPLFDEPYSRRCLLVTDDKHPADLIRDGQIDNIIRMAIRAGKSAITAVRMATLQAATHFGLKDVGAVAPGYRADLAIVDDLESFQVCKVYKNGKLVAENGVAAPFARPQVDEQVQRAVQDSCHVRTLTAEDFHIEPEAAPCRVIRVIPGQVLTDEWITELDFTQNNGVSIERDILKLAVVERHHNTGHIGLGYLTGIGLKRGAIASTVSHDSHNIIVIGTNERDMALAVNAICEMGGGNVIVDQNEIIASMPLPVGGLMSSAPATQVAQQNEAVRRAVEQLGTNNDIEPFMNMAFISLSVIPSLKMTTLGLVQVENQTLLPLFVK